MILTSAIYTCRILGNWLATQKAPELRMLALAAYRLETELRIYQAKEKYR